eukprot:TRINITY_DN2233_c0_g1_i2.p1 TRINITY_DN2233_c0_g1~~TRINITY_DN2233_c0_g1_i2.p1  ORF type:complete len:515 (+),score=123.82 TRINITY_DN2233_c0_g1_i2:47-1591(+)
MQAAGRRGHGGPDDAPAIRLSHDEMRDLLSDEDLLFGQSAPPSPSPSTSSAAGHLLAGAAAAPPLPSASLNPHKALAAAMQSAAAQPASQSAAMPASEDPAVLRLKGLARAEGVGEGSARTTLSPPLPTFGQPAAFADRQRRASIGSRSRVSSRACEPRVVRDRRARIDSAFELLEELLPLPPCTERRSRAEIIEHAVLRVRELQRCVNEAGERNGELHDLVEAMSTQQPEPSGPQPDGSSSGGRWAVFRSAMHGVSPLCPADMVTAGVVVAACLLGAVSKAAAGQRAWSLTVRSAVQMTLRLLLRLLLTAAVLRWAMPHLRRTTAWRAQYPFGAKPPTSTAPRPDRQQWHQPASRRSSISAAESVPQGRPIQPPAPPPPPPPPLAPQQTQRAAPTPHRAVAPAAQQQPQLRPSQAQLLSPHCRLGLAAGGAQSAWRKSHSAEDLDALNRIDDPTAQRALAALGRNRATSEPVPLPMVRPIGVAAGLARRQGAVSPPPSRSASGSRSGSCAGAG